MGEYADEIVDRMSDPDPFRGRRWRPAPPQRREPPRKIESIEMTEDTVEVTFKKPRSR